MIFAPFDAADISALRNVKKFLQSQKLTLQGLKLSGSLTTLFLLGTLPVPKNNLEFRENYQGL